MFDKKKIFTPLFSTCFWIRDPGWIKIRIRDNIPDRPHCIFVLVFKQSFLCSYFLILFNTIHASGGEYIELFTKLGRKYQHD